MKDFLATALPIPPGDTVGHSEVVTPKALLCPHKFCRAQKKFF